MKRLIDYLSGFSKELWVLAAGWFVAAVGFAASMPFVAIYFAEVLHLSAGEIGIFFAVMAIVRSLFQAVGGELSDRIGRLPLLIHSQTLRAITFVALALAIQYNMGLWWVSGLLLINAVVGSMFMPAVNAMVSDILPAEKRLEGFAFTRSAGNLGWAFGPAIGGFLAGWSWAALFYISAVLTVGSGLIFWLYLKPIVSTARSNDRFKFSDLLEVRKDKLLGIHVGLSFMLYLVHAQLIAPLSVYSVEIAGISTSELGWLFTVNGLMVAALQMPVTKMLIKYRFTTQLAVGSLFYFIGYGALGLYGGVWFFMLIIVTVSTGELFISPPSLTIVSRLAPEGRTGRYMGVHGFLTTAGWSLGPLWGGFFIEGLAHSPFLMWLCIASLAPLVGVGYWLYGKKLPDKFNR